MALSVVRLWGTGQLGLGPRDGSPVMPTAPRSDGLALVRLSLACYIACVVLANLAIIVIGIIPVGFGLRAPAGVFFAGLAFSARDWVQERAGRRAVVGAILVGAALSAGLSGRLAVASGVAFLVSELADFAVYSPLRARSMVAAIALSNTVGLMLDSILFLALAFGSLEFLAGQVVGKLEATLPILVGYALLAWRPRRALAQ
jgi:uncharacterized PurR-regulated membrane protein YhhQ (DUF165 family)